MCSIQISEGPGSKWRVTRALEIYLANSAANVLPGLEQLAPRGDGHLPLHRSCQKPLTAWLQSC